MLPPSRDRYNCLAYFVNAMIRWQPCPWSIDPVLVRNVMLVAVLVNHGGSLPGSNQHN